MSEMTSETIGFEADSGGAMPGLEQLMLGTKQQLLDHIDFLKEKKEAIKRPLEQFHVIKMEDEDFTLRDSFCTEMGTLLAGRLGDEGVTPEGYVTALNQLVSDCMAKSEGRTLEEPMPLNVSMAPQARYDYFSSYEGPMYAHAFGDNFARQVRTVQETALLEAALAAQGPEV